MAIFTGKRCAARYFEPEPGSEHPLAAVFCTKDTAVCGQCHVEHSEVRKQMKLSLKATTLSLAALFGAGMLVVGAVHMAVPSYGGEFLRAMSSVWPGADTTPTLGHVLIGTVYGALDGAVAGYLFGLLYRAFAHNAPAVSK
jgi:hypothetical protein